jgi:hypothetical protein
VVGESVFVLNRIEAVAVLQDILINFSGRSIDSFGVSKTCGTNESAGYKLYIKGVIDESSKRRIMELAKKYRLSIKEDNGLVIYQPPILDAISI